MNDDRIWSFEESLWTASDEHYHESIARDGVMVVPEEPFVLSGKEAADAMAKTPRWDEAKFSEKKVSRPDGDQGGLIVIAYRMDAKKTGADGEEYTAYCTSTYQRLGHEDWVVIQHQQTVPLVAKG